MGQINDVKYRLLNKLVNTGRVRGGGFTIAELLIVIVVIGILAALSYVGYGQVQGRAIQSAIASDLVQVNKLMEIERTRSVTREFPRGVPAEYSPSGGVETSYVYGGSDDYCIQSASKKDSSVVYYVRNGSSPAPGDCSGDGLADIRCVFKNIYAVYRYTNRTNEAITVTVVHPWGTHTFTVNPGATGSTNAFNSRQSQLEAGFVETTVTEVGASLGTVTKKLYHKVDALSCS